MKKSLFIAITLLLAFGLSSCVEENHSSGKKGGGSSIVIPPGGVTPSHGNDQGGEGGEGGQQGGEGGQQGGEGGEGGQQGGEGGEGGQQGGEKTPKPGDKCSADVCVGQQVLYCNMNYRIYVLDATCPDSMVCALRYNKDKTKAYAGCYDTCTAEDVGKQTTSCQSQDNMTWTVPATCEASADDRYISIPDYSDSSAITPCKGDCQAGQCLQLADDEGQPCDMQAYTMHCSGNALVFCSNGTVAVSNCAKVDGATTCAELNDSTTKMKAACIDANKKCQERLDRSYLCDDSRKELSGKYNLIAYQCLTSKDGSLVAIRDEFFSDVLCGETCDSETGQCCDQETGICTFEELDD